MGTYEEIMNLLENGKLIGTKKNPEFDLMEVHCLNKKFSEWCNCFCLDKNGLIEAILESKKATEVMTNIAMAWLLALKFQFKNEYLYDKRNEYSVKTALAMKMQLLLTELTGCVTGSKTINFLMKAIRIGQPTLTGGESITIH